MGDKVKGPLLASFFLSQKMEGRLCSTQIWDKEQQGSGARRGEAGGGVAVSCERVHSADLCG